MECINDCYQSRLSSYRDHVIISNSWYRSDYWCYRGNTHSLLLCLVTLDQLYVVLFLCVVQDGEFALLRAVASGDEALVRMLLDAGADVNHTRSAQFYKHDPSAIFVAVRRENIPMLKLLLARGASPEVYGPCGAGLLRISTDKKEQELSKVLLDAGALIYHAKGDLDQCQKIAEVLRGWRGISIKKIEAAQAKMLAELGSSKRSRSRRVMLNYVNQGKSTDNIGPNTLTGHAEGTNKKSSRVNAKVQDNDYKPGDGVDDDDDDNEDNKVVGIDDDDNDDEKVEKKTPRKPSAAAGATGKSRKRKNGDATPESRRAGAMRSVAPSGDSDNESVSSVASTPSKEKQRGRGRPTKKQRESVTSTPTNDDIDNDIEDHDSKRSTHSRDDLSQPPLPNSPLIGGRVMKRPPSKTLGSRVVHGALTFPESPSLSAMDSPSSPNNPPRISRASGGLSINGVASLISAAAGPPSPSTLATRAFTLDA
jgi:hypothetical protein